MGRWHWVLVQYMAQTRGSGDPRRRRGCDHRHRGHYGPGPGTQARDPSRSWKRWRSLLPSGPKRTQPASALVFIQCHQFCASAFRNGKTINLCCFASLGLWKFIIAALEKPPNSAKPAWSVSMVSTNLAHILCGKGPLLKHCHSLLQKGKMLTLRKCPDSVSETHGLGLLEWGSKARLSGAMQPIGQGSLKDLGD